uniref:Uncharacterized protein LOC117346714 isoform X3 n=1 Tax=Geotrypetes seraphini TaxID=260995 RepID=A0A6P8PAS6_GEOSA|nr:uncharacterized protein LOC117346714 isoform X3 [Geotrypetes seraphini]
MDHSNTSLEICTESTPVIEEKKECFICREEDDNERDQEAPLNFCSCKNLTAHQKCLLNWIQKGSDGSSHPQEPEDTEYITTKKLLLDDLCFLHQQVLTSNQFFTRSQKINKIYLVLKGSVWKILICQWQSWLLLCFTVALMAVVPLTVYLMVTAFKDPPPHWLFNAAAVCFGVLAETLLIKCLMCYFSRKHNKVKISSLSIQSRIVDYCDSGIGLLHSADQDPSKAMVRRDEMKK